MVANLSFLDPKGVALISWTVTIMAMAGLGLMVADVKKWLWGTVFVVGLAAEQFVAGVCLLSFNFWNATYVMYGDSSGLANAANLGIIAAGCGVAVYAVLWVGLLVCIKKESKFNVLTRSWASFLLFFVIEIIALAVVFVRRPAERGLIRHLLWIRFGLPFVYDFPLACFARGRERAGIGPAAPRSI